MYSDYTPLTLDEWIEFDRKRKSREYEVDIISKDHFIVPRDVPQMSPKMDQILRL